MLWPRAIGVNAAILGVRFLREVMRVECVVDPFCGTAAPLVSAAML
jgi:hypothetical protein